MYQIEDIKNTIIQGNVLTELQKIPNESIDTIITSPPYWSLRDYGEETKIIWDGDKNCEHEWVIETYKRRSSDAPAKINRWNEKAFEELRRDRPIKNAFCHKCGAWCGQLGLEPTLDLYLSHLWQITNELYRVLKKTGVMFWNHGDSYCGSQWHFDAKNPKAREGKLIPNWENYPKKCLYLQNFRLIMRMIDEQGWILRNTIIWHKPNNMPSSTRDRFTNTYEPVFMLVKGKKYYFDLDAVRIPWKQTSIDRLKYPVGLLGDPITRRPSLSGKRVLLNPNEYKYTHYPQDQTESFGRPWARYSIHLGENPIGKNPGDLWSIFTQPFKDAHFATFPEKLIEPMILAGCPKNGIVLDPFIGSGTTATVAKRLGRNWIGIELNPKYIEMAQKRIGNTFGQEELFDSL